MAISAVHSRRLRVSWSWGVCSTARPLPRDCEDPAGAHLQLLGVLMLLLGGGYVKECVIMAGCRSRNRG